MSYPQVPPDGAPIDQLPCDTELAQEIEKKLPRSDEDIARIWKAVEDIAKGG